MKLILAHHFIKIEVLYLMNQDDGEPGLVANNFLLVSGFFFLKLSSSFLETIVFMIHELSLIVWPTICQTSPWNHVGEDSMGRRVHL